MSGSTQHDEKQNQEQRQSQVNSDGTAADENVNDATVLRPEGRGSELETPEKKTTAGLLGFGPDAKSSEHHTPMTERSLDEMTHDDDLEEDVIDSDKYDNLNMLKKKKKGNRGEDEMAATATATATANGDDDDNDSHSDQPQQLTTMKKRSLSEQWASAIHGIRFWVTRGMKCITYVAATWPRLTLLFCSALSVALLIPGFWYRFTLELDNYDLWPPTDSLSRQHWDWYWRESEFNYEPLEISVYVHKNGANVLGQEGVQRVFDVLETVTEMYGYKDGCEQAELYGDIYGVGQCHITSVADFWNESRSVLEETVDSDEDAIWYMSQTVYPNGIIVDRKRILGNGKVQSGELLSTGNEKEQLSFVKSTRNEPFLPLDSAQAYIIQFGIPWSEVTRDFEANAIDNLLALQQEWDDDPNNPFQVELRSHSSFSDEFLRSIMLDLPLLPFAAFLMCFFTLLVFAKCDRVHSRGLLGIGAVLCIVASVMASFGIMFLLQVPFTTQTTMLPFLMFGIGLDDAFIIFGSYNRKDPSMDVVERVQATIEDIGNSIFLTTITSALAFGLGAFSAIPAVSWLCLYAFPAILIDFFYQITFFIAILVLDERRIQANRMDWCTCIRVERQDNVIVTTKEEAAEGEMQQADSVVAEQEQQQQPEESLIGQNPSQDDGIRNNGDNDNHNDNNSNDNRVITLPSDESEYGNGEEIYVKSHPADRFMAWFATKLLKPKVQVVVMFLFAFVLGGSIYNTTQLKQEFDFTELVPRDSLLSEASYLRRYFNAWEKYSDVGLYVDTIFRDVDQSDPAIQEQMEKYVTDLTSKGLADEPTYFWLRDFKAFIAEAANRNLTELPFGKQIDAFLDVPINYELYDGAIGRSRPGGRIHESRVELHLPVDTTDSKDSTEMLSALRAVSKSQEINQGVEEWRFFTYDSEYHIYEFYDKVVEELIFTTIMGVVAVGVIALLFIPHWTAMPFILVFISFLYIEMLGFLYMSRVQINAISYVTLVMSIGLMVDYIMHILLRYFESEGKTRGERVKDSLSTLGASMLLGAISTFLGIILLGFSNSEILQNVFISIIGLILLGVLNGLVFLPVTLALIGPE